MENITVAERNKTALAYGVLLGVMYLVITTAVNTMISSLFMYYLLKVLGYIIYMIIAGVLVARIRKANGGYLEFREAFGAIFIILLVAGFMAYLYNYLYISVIDPHFMDKIKIATVTYMEKANVPQDKIDKTVRDFDAKVADAKTFHFWTYLLTFLSSVLFDCLVGLIVCAVVKKSRPVFGN